MRPYQPLKRRALCIGVPSSRASSLWRRFNDAIHGGSGDDIYYVDSVGDTTIEAVDEGIDSVHSTVSYTLGANVEMLTLTGVLAINGTGNSLDNSMTGNAAANVFYLQHGGSDTASGGDGNDIFYYGGALTSADQNFGGAGIDTLVLQGNYSSVLILGTNSLVQFEGISLQSGTITRWGDTSGNLYDYNLQISDANVAMGQQFRVNAQSLVVGEDFTFNGSAETDGKFLVYAGFGTDTLTGGAGNDIFFFEAGRFGSADTINGGGGADGVVISGGAPGSPGLLALNIQAGSFTGIESLSFNGRFASDPSARPSYEVVLQNGNIAAGATLIVNGSSLASTQSLSFSASAETLGRLVMYGGAGADTFHGGANDDLFYAGEGIDYSTGGGGSDTFQYRSAADSTTAATDRIYAFQSGTDKIDLSYIDAIQSTAGNDAFSFIGSASFSNTAGELRAQYDANSNIWTIQGDTNGDGVADLQIFAYGNSLAAADFLL